MKSAIQHLNIHVTGKVQGVYFRKSTFQVARELGLTGYTMNAPDGSVIIEVEGPAERVDQLLSWCRQGPPQARVDQVIANAGPMIGFTRFEIRR